VARSIDFLAQLTIISLIARYLGAERYGDYGYVMAFSFIAVVFTFTGIERITTREISKHPDHAGSYLGGAIIVRWFYMTILIALITIFIWFIGLSSEVILAIYITTLAWNFGSDTLIYLAMFKAFEKMGYEILLSLTLQCLYVGFILLIRYFNLGFITIIVGFLAANLARNLLAVRIACKRFVKPDFRVSLPLFKVLIKESYILGLVGLLSQGFINVDTLMLKAFKDTFEVSMFYAPHNLIIFANLIPVSLMSALLPALSRDAGTNAEALHYKYEKSFKLLALVSLFWMTISIVFSHQIILMLFGQQFSSAEGPFRILSLSLVFTMLFTAVDYTLVAVRRQNLLIFCVGSGLVTKILLGLLLIPAYGYIGASAGAAFGYFVFFCVGFFIVSKYVVILPIHRILLKPVLAAGITGFCLWWFNHGNMYLLSLLGLVIYSLTLSGLRCFSPDEIDFFRNAPRRVIGIFFGKRLNV
jgi:O-antigen/teichoic acid export membrane protein